MSQGCLHLLPVGLGSAAPALWLPPEAQATAARLTHFVCETPKSARAFLKQIETTHPLQSITLHGLDARTPDGEIRQWLKPVKDGLELGLVSDAGCPAVADPGARVVAMAHEMGIRVRPWTGPSSLLLGLMASGLEGQRFAFHGYPPVKEPERTRQLQAWEQHSARNAETQLLIETPYRNAALWPVLLEALRGDTRLCVASAISTSEESIRTLPVSRWRELPAPQMDRLPTVFLFLAASAHASRARASR